MECLLPKLLVDLATNRRDVLTATGIAPAAAAAHLSSLLREFGQHCLVDFTQYHVPRRVEIFVPVRLIRPAPEAVLKRLDLLQVGGVSEEVPTIFSLDEPAPDHGQLIRVYRQAIDVGVTQPAQSVKDLSTSHEIERRE